MFFYSFDAVCWKIKYLIFVLNPFIAIHSLCNQKWTHPVLRMKQRCLVEDVLETGSQFLLLHFLQSPPQQPGPPTSSSRCSHNTLLSRFAEPRQMRQRVGDTRQPCYHWNTTCILTRTNVTCDNCVFILVSDSNMNHVWMPIWRHFSLIFTLCGLLKV